MGGYHTLARSVGSLAQNAGSSSDDNVPIVSGMRCLAAHLPLAQRVVPGTTLHSAEGTLYHQRVCALCGPALFCAYWLHKSMAGLHAAFLP